MGRRQPSKKSNNRRGGVDRFIQRHHASCNELHRLRPRTLFACLIFLFAMLVLIYRQSYVQLTSNEHLSESMLPLLQVSSSNQGDSLDADISPIELQIYSRITASPDALEYVGSKNTINLIGKYLVRKVINLRQRDRLTQLIIDTVLAIPNLRIWFSAPKYINQFNAKAFYHSLYGDIYFQADFSKLDSDVILHEFFRAWRAFEGYHHGRNLIASASDSIRHDLAMPFPVVIDDPASFVELEEIISIGDQKILALESQLKLHYQHPLDPISSELKQAMHASENYEAMIYRINLSSQDLNYAIKMGAAKLNRDQSSQDHRVYDVIAVNDNAMNFYDSELQQKIYIHQITKILDGSIIAQGTLSRYPHKTYGRLAALIRDTQVLKLNLYAKTQPHNGPREKIHDDHYNLAFRDVCIFKLPKKTREYFYTELSRRHLEQAQRLYDTLNEQTAENQVTLNL